MIRAFAIAAIVALGAITAVAAPALSVEPYTPPPVEFGMAAPLEGLGEPGGRGFVSRPMHAPKRFDIVGFTWEGQAEPAISVRVRAEGEQWGDWTPVPTDPDGAPDPNNPEPAAEATPEGASAPVWAGGADLVQYRLSRRPPDLRLEFVNTTGTATAMNRLETAVRGAANDAVVAMAGLASAQAGTGRPDMVSREGWGAEDCRPRQRPDYGEVKAVFVHHTVNANDYSRSDARAMVLGICRYHRNTLGWDDIGYQFLVDKYGTIYEGRAGGVNRAVIGAQTQGFNDQSTGIANLGTFESRRQTRRGIKAVARVIRWKLPLHGQRTQGRTTLVSRGGEHNRWPRGTKVRLKRISGHRDGGLTECPGSALYRQLPRIRRLSDVVPPDAPEGLRARSRGRRIKLNWDDNTEADLRGYRVYRKLSDGSWQLVDRTRESRFVHRRRKVGRTYTYAVRAFDRARNLSRLSDPASATVLP
ncbi:MAG TPA: N-acetylmuramoyl-L-alanine amidase [Thermoleophilaceae bacterium]|nr:N-acetylmuramoyl-L-alanine amidase [Thermoleophilaceae bacterium]